MLVLAVVVIDQRIFQYQDGARFASARMFGETDKLPLITLAVVLDDEARAWLRDMKESISGTIWFDGDGEGGVDARL